MKSYQKNLKGKHVLVIGLARSGRSATQLLLKLGAHVTVTDQTPREKVADADEIESQGVRLVLGGHPLSLLDEPLDLIVKNPGIPYTQPFVQAAVEKGVPIVTEVDLAGGVIGAPLIAVTGSNGKTTTSQLLADMLRESFSANKEVYLAGNIGVPLSSEALSIKPTDEVVVEVSSFQLMGMPTFKPKVAVMTNIYSAHLDYHGSRAEYVQAKMRLTENQTAADYLVYNADQPELSKLVKAQSDATLIPFSRKKIQEEGAYVKEKAVYFRDEEVLPLDLIRVPGDHNVENVLAAVAAAKLRGASNEGIRRAVADFKGVKHRTQYVGEVSGRVFYNDSKATNLEATIKALSGFKQPVILIAGGLDRGNSFEDLMPSLKAHVKTLLTFGETAERLAATGRASGVPKVWSGQTVSEAVERAFEDSQRGDIILLSPANASWDQYQTFEDRGDDFIAAVKKL